MFNHIFESNRKRKIVVELDERYFDKKSLMYAVVQHFTNEGKQCEMIDVNTLILDGKKYYVHETNVAATYCPPVQRAVLTKID
ncbi:hypothetical protein [Anoxybacillus ayderensis]|uniref:hypothetical protein n=1 Tax=Anoxybacillus ayderensis TaxID=265546 RepID=UPI000A2673CB|nr:hypothetical protein [Anoxybacillus ayderensis]MED0657143.1 hypothetical protein [Anoxybacillus ayderensis]OSX53595.1 hypothetical protein B7H16_10665 [Anoxybacillus ayderensis]